jgi:hypothetical protein
VTFAFDGDVEARRGGHDAFAVMQETVRDMDKVAIDGWTSWSKASMNKQDSDDPWTVQCLDAAY